METPDRRLNFLNPARTLQFLGSYGHDAHTGNLWITSRLLLFVPVDLTIRFARGFPIELSYF